jgi:hypothetical protein
MKPCAYETIFEQNIACASGFRVQGSGFKVQGLEGG